MAKSGATTTAELGVFGSKLRPQEGSHNGLRVQERSLASLRNKVFTEFNREGLELLKKSMAFNTALEEFMRKGEREKLNLLNQKTQNYHSHHETLAEENLKNFSPFRPSEDEEAPYASP